MQKLRSLLTDVNFTELLKYISLAGAVIYLLIYFWVAYFRLRYPFELEWIEGGMVDEVQRIVRGESIYVAPSINFVPFLYPPMFFYISAMVSSVLGDGFLPLRLVSFAASLVSFSVIFLIVSEETGNWRSALISTGLFAATFRVTGDWLDLARVDSLFLAFWLLFIYFVRDQKSLVYSLLAGVFAAMAFLTKQTALIASLPIMLPLFYWNWKRALSLLATAALIVGITTLILNQMSSGWYVYYVFDLLSQQAQWLPLLFVSFWRDDILVHLPLAVLFITYFLIGRKLDRFSLVQWLSILMGALAASFITRVKIGGDDNVLLPAYAVLSILFGLGLDQLLKLADQLHVDHRGRAGVMIYIACLIQLIILFYNPLPLIPKKADLNNGHKLVQLLSEVDGEVFLPNQGYLPTLAGKRPYAHHSAIWDVLKGDVQTEGKSLLMESLNDAIRHQTFDMIILVPGWSYCCIEIDQYYTKMDDPFQDGTVFYWDSRPISVYKANRLK
jgi:4-amino-4-deoxy-L-arabinose transferase-like glycosyltransferase